MVPFYFVLVSRLTISYFFLSKEKKYWKTLNQIDSIAFIILKIILPRAAQKRTDQQQFRG